MKNNSENDLSAVSSSAGIEKIKEIERFSAWGVLGLSMITFGFYTFFWLFSRTKILNEKLPEEDRIASWIPIVGVVAFLLYFVLSIGPALIISSSPELAAVLMGIGAIIGLVYMVVFLIWIFKFRSRLNLLSGSHSGEKLWLGGILTFLANVLYFQWKINQIHDHG
jgi:threonine/homoserine/homoserine lactone efflux protein